ncbi:MAG: ABC transporter transmembrane domain-containing protein [Pseudomonadota bacterium]|nr:ABC transporter transmembrane domain-containing protein [Pseudomonadota bacterium]
MNTIGPENRPKAKSIQPLRTLIPFIAYYKGTLLIAILALLVSSAALLAMPIAVRNVIDHGFSVEDAANVDRYFFILLCFVFVIGFFGAMRAYFVNWLGERVVADLRKKVFAHVIYMDSVFFETTKIGEVLSRLTTDTTLIQSVSGVTISIFLRSSIQLIGGLVLLGVTSMQLLGVLMLIFPLVVLPIMLVGRWVRKLSRDSQDRIADASGQATEILGNVQTVQSFTAEHLEIERFSASIQTSFRTAVRRIRVRALFTTVGTISVFGALIFVLWLGAKEVLAGTLSGGELGQFVLYAMLVGVAAGSLSEVWGEVQRAAGAMERLTELLNIQSNIRIPEVPVAFPSPARGAVRFEQVDFSYPSRHDEFAIKQFSLDIEPGEHVAFVGPSGAGKSTILQLLLRFYDPQSGRIYIDGVDINLADPKIVRSLMALVPQDCVIFGDSVESNIRFGRPSASNAQIVGAAKAALAHDFIDQLPDGYDTFLGEKGTRISGGQKQRIAIARAILADPAILLLDEATSALDAESERLVQAALNTLQKNRTTLVIAHRLATIHQADKIVVLNSGKILDVGKHSELMARNTAYAQMVELQFGGLISAS